MIYKIFNKRGQVIDYTDKHGAVEYGLSLSGYSWEELSQLTYTDIIERLRIKLINKQLEPYDAEYKDVVKGGSKEYIKVFKPSVKTTLFGFIKIPRLFEKVVWHKYYTFKTKEEYDQWKSWAIREIRLDLKMNKKQAETEFAWFDLSFGLCNEYLLK